MYCKGKENGDYKHILMQMRVERESGILLISEQYRKPETCTWLENRAFKAAIVIRNKTLSIKGTG